MKNSACLSARVTNEKQNEIWKDNGNILLSAEMEYFVFSGEKDNRITRRINLYYKHMNRQLIRYCKSKVLPKSISDYRSSTKNAEPFNGVKISSKAKLTYNNNGILSLYTDISEYDDLIGNILTVRFGDVWSLTTGCPLPMSSFFPKNDKYKKKLKVFVANEVKKQRDLQLGSYFENQRKNCSKFFSAENYYISSEGLVVFYPMYSIASKAASIPAFTMSWRENGPCEPLSLL